MSGNGQRESGRGFTLIELLVVISILTLLMALLLPVLSQVRKQARTVVCQGRERDWSLMFAAYQSEHDGCFPDGTFATRDDLVPYCHVPWACHMEVYSGSDLREAMLCPSTPQALPPDAFRTRGREVAGGTTFVAWRFDCDADIVSAVGPPHVTYAASYATNNRFAWNNSRDRVELAKISPAELPIFFDCRLSRCAFDDSSSAEPPPYEDAELVGGPCGDATALAINRHQGGVNMTFLDGTVRHVDVKELWTLRWHHEYDTAGPWTQAGGARPEDWPPWMRRFKDY